MKLFSDLSISLAGFVPGARNYK